MRAKQTKKRAGKTDKKTGRKTKFNPKRSRKAQGQRLARSPLARTYALAHKNAGKTVGVYCFYSPRFCPISFPNLGKSENSHIKQKPYIVFDLLNLIQYMVSVAGVAGFEPTNDGVRGDFEGKISSDLPKNPQSNSDGFTANSMKNTLKMPDFCFSFSVTHFCNTSQHFPNVRSRNKALLSCAKMPMLPYKSCLFRRIRVFHRLQ